MLVHELLQAARSEYRDELRIPHLTSLAPPTTLRQDGSRWEDEASRLGPNMSGDLQRRLGHPAGYGKRFPWTGSAFYIGHICRHEHPGHHERPAFRGSLCRQLVRLTVPLGYSVENAAQILEITPARAERHLLWALRWIQRDVTVKCMAS